MKSLKVILIALISTVLISSCEKEDFAPQNEFPGLNELPAPPKPKSPLDQVETPSHWTPLEKSDPLDEVLVNIAVENMRYWSKDQQQIVTTDELVLLTVPVPRDELEVRLQRDFRWELLGNSVRVPAGVSRSYTEQYKVGVRTMELSELGYSTSKEFSTTNTQSTTNSSVRTTTNEFSASLGVPLANAVSLGAGFRREETFSETIQHTSESSVTETLSETVSQIFRKSITLYAEEIKTETYDVQTSAGEQVISFWKGVDRFTFVDVAGAPLTPEQLLAASPTLKKVWDQLKFHNNDPVIFPLPQVHHTRNQVYVDVTRF